jgi:hypothetical protein
MPGRDSLSRVNPILTVAAALAVAVRLTSAQPVAVPPTPVAWNASDSIRFETYLGRQAVYINRGVALARGVEMRDGTIEYDWAATPRTSFLGASFHATAPNNTEAVFFRPGSSGASDAVQYGPALNTYGVAWQVYHGPGATAPATLQRERWTHVRMVVAGDSAQIFLDGGEQPVLVVPRLYNLDGSGVGVWTGNFGRGAYFSNFTVTPAPNATARSAAPTARRGSITDWELSPALDAQTVTPGSLPKPSSLSWEKIAAEPTGLVLVNRYRVTPIASVPVDTATHEVNVDSVMGGRVRGSMVVFARSVLQSPRDEIRRLQFAYSDGMTIYLNGQPLFFGMNPQGLRDNLGLMPLDGGDAVYLPLKRGRNELVVAVTEYSGGWAFWARLDPHPLSPRRPGLGRAP